MKSPKINLALTSKWRVGSPKGYNANTIYTEDGEISICQVYGICTNREVEEEKDSPGMPVAQLIVDAVNERKEDKAKIKELKKVLKGMLEAPMMTDSTYDKVRAIRQRALDALK